MNLNDCLLSAIQASIEAGKEILNVYNSDDFNIEKKDDQSPLTIADKKAHIIIKNILEKIEFPILSEEGKEYPFSERKNWNTLWIVDPLDGTKEFIKRNGEFTVNIALVKNGIPVLGVIYVPVTSTLFFAHSEIGSYKAQINKETNITLDSLIKESKKLPIYRNDNHYIVVASRSHMSPETEQYVEELKQKHSSVSLTSMGSSLKICLVAEGKADSYPRFAPTMEWDTAAGHAIAKFAGKKFIDYTTQQEMLYNRENLRNNWFLVN